MQAEKEENARPNVGRRAIEGILAKHLRAMS
jgi:hypothetical protein